MGKRLFNAMLLNEHEETDMEFVTVIKNTELKLPPGDQLVNQLR